jgi:hypothetical protein
MIPKLDNCFNSLSRGVQKNTNRPPQHVAKWWCYLHDNRVIKCPHTKPSPRMSRNEYYLILDYKLKFTRLRGKTKIKWKHRDPYTRSHFAFRSTNRNSFLFNWRGENSSFNRKWFNQNEIPFKENNNVWAFNMYFDKDKPTLLLNSHHDTVRPNQAYTNDPLKAIVRDGKLFGLGSNDAGGCLVSLLATFVHFMPMKLYLIIS